MIKPIGSAVPRLLHSSFFVLRSEIIAVNRIDDFVYSSRLALAQIIDNVRYATISDERYLCRSYIILSRFSRFDRTSLFAELSVDGKHIKSGAYKCIFSAFTIAGCKSPLASKRPDDTRARARARVRSFALFHAKIKGAPRRELADPRISFC